MSARQNTYVKENSLLMVSIEHGTKWNITGRAVVQ